MSAYSDCSFNGYKAIVHKATDYYATAMNVPTGVVYAENIAELSFGGEDHTGHRRENRIAVFIPGVFWDAEQDCFVKIGKK